MDLEREALSNVIGVLRVVSIMLCFVFLISVWLAMLYLFVRYALYPLLDFLSLGLRAITPFILVPQGFAYTLERANRFRRILDPGLHFRIPFLERVRHKISTREVTLAMPNERVFFCDHSAMEIGMTLYLSVESPEKAAYASEDYLSELKELAKTRLQAALFREERVKFFERRPAIQSALTKELKGASEYLGVCLKDLALLPNPIEAVPKV